MYESRIERIEEDRSNRKQVKSIKTTVEATFEDGTKSTEIHVSNYLLAFMDKENKDHKGIIVQVLQICTPSFMKAAKKPADNVFQRFETAHPSSSNMLREMMKECGDEPDFMDILESLLKDQDEKVPEKAEGSE